NLTPGSSIPINYHSLFGSHDDILLLEVDDKLLPDLINNRVTIRGQPHEEAVLCSPSSTYAMKFVGTSNSVFLIPAGETTLSSSNLVSTDGEANNSAVMESVASVLKVAPGTMELILTAPRLDKLRTFLNERPYILEEDLEINSNRKKGLYSWQDLLELIQASEEELRSALKSLSAVEIDGYWRIIDAESMDKILNMILNNSILCEWPLNSLPEDQLVSALAADGFPERIVLHCLETFGSKEDNMGDCLWSLNEKRVCLNFASKILSGGKMKLEKFMEKWLQSIPSGMNADLKMLEGEILYDKIGVESWIRAFSVSALPTVPADRFAALFRERSKWEWKDLEPYIRDLKIPGLSSEALLIKYTRRSQANPDVEPTFTAR
ncbi:sister chromatid cohesion protein DCC1, partial [Asparagus officinalis]